MITFLAPLTAPPRHFDAPGTAAARSLDDLVHPLMAEAERLGNLAQRPSGQLHAAYRPVEIGPRDVRVPLRLYDALLGGPCLLKQVRIDRHVV